MQNNTVNKAPHYSGQTEDNKPVFKIFWLVDERGTQLIEALEYCYQKNVMPDWVDYFDQAYEKGWNVDRALSKMSILVNIIYSKEWHDEWLERMYSFMRIRAYLNN